jgi:predicted RNase H-like nuclease
VSGSEITVAGIDGCKGGWVCVFTNVSGGSERAFIAEHIGEVLRHPDAPAVIAIDIPIGLPERVERGRACDIAARAALGRRGSAVFLVPSRAAVRELDYRQACAASLATSDPPRQISKQTYHLFPKIREVDDIMTPALQSRLFECHPELAFCAMNGGEPLSEPKKLGGRPNSAGLAFRRDLLANAGFSAAFLAETKFRLRDAGADDFLDACACAWSAARILRGDAISFPKDPPFDGRGLRMRIVV